MANSLFGSPARAPQWKRQNNARRGRGGINNQALQSVKRMVGMYRAAKNPDAALQMMAQQNPAIGDIMRVCAPGGLQNSFYQLCKEQGVNPDDVLSQIM